MRESSPVGDACLVCGELPLFVAANLREGERLPEAASRLVDLHPHPEGFWDTAKDYELTKVCPACGRQYTYGYHHDFSPGYVEESEWLERRPAPGSRPVDGS